MESPTQAMGETKGQPASSWPAGTCVWFTSSTHTHTYIYTLHKCIYIYIYILYIIIYIDILKILISSDRNCLPSGSLLHPSQLMLNFAAVTSAVGIAPGDHWTVAFHGSKSSLRGDHVQDVLQLVLDGTFFEGRKRPRPRVPGHKRCSLKHTKTQVKQSLAIFLHIFTTTIYYHTTLYIYIIMYVHTLYDTKSYIYIYYI